MKNAIKRNHNGLSNRRQDPAAWSRPAQLAMKSALEDRYLLLPYLYTLMYKAHKHGDMVVTPLLANYPSDKQTWEIDEQLMWGDGILISPVLHQGETSVRIRSRTLLAITVLTQNKHFFVKPKRVCLF